MNSEIYINRLKSNANCSLKSRKSPFDFEAKNNDPLEIFKIKQDILSGKRENPISGTNDKIVALYESKYCNIILSTIFFITI